MFAPTHKQQGRDTVDEDADRRHSHHRGSLHGLGVAEAKHRLNSDDRSRHDQQQGIKERGQDRRTSQAVGVTTTGA
jgi:hypothetical protein